MAPLPGASRSAHTNAGPSPNPDPSAGDAAMPPKTATKKKPAATKSRSGAARKRSTKTPTKAASKTTAPPSRSVPSPSRASRRDDDDELLLHGGASGGFGRCGGRPLTSRLEQTLCDLLSTQGVTHSHSPRHFEVQIGEKSVAAYAPMIVLRGRGREGKTVVIEACEELDGYPLDKVVAFRSRYGIEFYIYFVAPEEVLDDVPVQAYDESSTTTDARTLISRLAD